MEEEIQFSLGLVELYIVSPTAVELTFASLSKSDPVMSGRGSAGNRIDIVLPRAEPVQLMARLTFSIEFINHFHLWENITYDVIQNYSTNQWAAFDSTWLSSARGDTR